MVSTQGFNALLKLVEEPPEHLRFIFATTEPDKVIPTIRSRTHHYPFRLIPPRLLSSYLTDLCQQEGVTDRPGRAPARGPRRRRVGPRHASPCSTSCIGGAGDGGVTHDLAADLLGYTPDTLLDEVVDAFAAGDGGSVFAVVDKVIETGQDPRRFTEDLLRRLRDLVIVDAVPEATASGSHRRLRGPGRAAGRPGGAVRQHRPQPRRRHRRDRADRDARRHRAPAAPRADLRPGAAARRRPHHPRSRRPARPARAAPGHQRYAAGGRARRGTRSRTGSRAGPGSRAHRSATAPAARAESPVTEQPSPPQPPRPPSPTPEPAPAAPEPTPGRRPRRHRPGR